MTEVVDGNTMKAGVLNVAMMWRLSYTVPEVEPSDLKDFLIYLFIYF